VRPWFGRFPDAAILFMRSIGLAAFVAMVGLKAGPIFIAAVRENGDLLFLGGIVVTSTPMISGLFFGHYVLKVNPALLVGGLAGAQTMIAGVAAAQEKSVRFGTRWMARENWGYIRVCMVREPTQRRAKRRSCKRNLRWQLEDSPGRNESLRLNRNRWLLRFERSHSTKRPEMGGCPGPFYTKI
jgi:hypothetical protein